MGFATGLFSRKRAKPAFRLYFATDVHGSDRCFRKFLAAAWVYEANALILGGDVAGKAMVPIVPQTTATYSYSLHGAQHTVSADELDEVEQRMKFNGLYPCIAEPSQLQRMGEDPQYVAALFEDAIAAQLTAWCDLAAERLGDDVRCIITPGMTIRV